MALLTMSVKIGAADSEHCPLKELNTCSIHRIVVTGVVAELVVQPAFIVNNFNNSKCKVE
jgi:hypothetical protein